MIWIGLTTYFVELTFWHVRRFWHFSQQITYEAITNALGFKPMTSRTLSKPDFFRPKRNETNFWPDHNKTKRKLDKLPIYETKRNEAWENNFCLRNKTKYRFRSDRNKTKRTTGKLFWSLKRNDIEIFKFRTKRNEIKTTIIVWIIYVTSITKLFRLGCFVWLCVLRPTIRLYAVYLRSDMPRVH